MTIQQNTYELARTKSAIKIGHTLLNGLAVLGGLVAVSGLGIFLALWFYALKV